MKKETVKKLNQLNQDFYNTIGKEFDDTRSHIWPGWEKVLEIIQNKEIEGVLDIGCGNGRFGEFVLKNHSQAKTHDPKLIYTGIDSNEFLLKQAEEKLGKIATPTQQSHSRADGNPGKNQKFSLFKKDIIFDSWEKSFEKKFDLIVIFGVMHHIPGSQNRIDLIKKAKKLLTKNGLIIFTTWQFAENERLQKRVVCPNPETSGETLKKLDLNKDDLEENDYIMDWQRGKTAYRYCHHYSQEEVENICTKSKLKIDQTFLEDGKERSVNRYWVLEHSHPRAIKIR